MELPRIERREPLPRDDCVLPKVRPADRGWLCLLQQLWHAARRADDIDRARTRGAAPWIAACCRTVSGRDSAAVPAGSSASGCAGAEVFVLRRAHPAPGRADPRLVRILRNCDKPRERGMVRHPEALHA